MAMVYCHGCGKEIHETAHTCPNCGAPQGEATTGVQQAAESESKTRPDTKDKPALWNPSAAGAWSLIFTPAFGAILHSINWETLGDTEAAKQSKIWALGVIPVLIVSLAAPESGTGSLLGLIYLLGWYFGYGRKQVTYVNGRFGSDYRRKGWAKPLLIAIGAFFGFIIFMSALIGGQTP